MPYAVTHILIVLILIELYRDYFIKNKRAFYLHYVLIVGIAGLLFWKKGADNAGENPVRLSHNKD